MIIKINRFIQLCFSSKQKLMLILTRVSTSFKQLYKNESLKSAVLTNIRLLQKIIKFYNYL